MISSNSDHPSDAEIESFSTKKLVYTREMLFNVRNQLMFAYKYNMNPNKGAEVAAKFPNVLYMGLLGKQSPYIPRNNQRIEQTGVPVEVVLKYLNENAKPAEHSENDNEHSLLRLKEGVLNKTRLLQKKLEELKLKNAAASPE